MLGRNTQNTLLHAFKNVIRHLCIGLEYYIVDSVFNGTINKDMLSCLCQDTWIDLCVNTNTKFPHAPSIHHTNRNNQTMGQKLSGHLTKAKNLPYHLRTEYTYKRW